MQALSILFVVLLTLGTARAERDFNDYEFLSRAQTMVIENAQLIKLDFQKKLLLKFVEKPELLTDEDPTKMIEAIEDLASEGLPNKARIRISGILRNFFVGLGLEIRTMVRKFGLGTGIAYATIEISDEVATVLLIAAGKAQIAALVGALPVGTIFVIATVTINKIAKHRKTVKLYGGKERFKYYQKLNKEVQKTLRLKGKKAIIVPMERVSEDEINAITLSRLNFTNSLFSLIDRNRPKLDVLQLKYFLKRNEAWSDELETIRTTGASRALKVASMLSHIKSAKPDLYEEIQATFPESFITIPEFQFSEALKNWTLASAHAETKEELLKSVELIPIGSRAIDVAKIWSKLVAPHILEETKGFSLKTYRGLSKSLAAIEISAELDPAKLVDESWRKDFYSGLKKLLKL